jgi:hypothetical protein
MALGKEGNQGTGKAIFAECYCQGTRQRDWQRGPLEDSLPSAIPLDTWQRSLLCRVPMRALGTETGDGAHWTHLCRVPWQQTLGKGSVTWRRDGDFSLPSVIWHSAKVPDKKYSAKVPDKKYSAKRLLRCTVRRAFFAECDTRQRLCRV